ncbi:RNA polymerase sigma factor [Chitinophaga ginsengisoli]|uniref:RNA polymerase sigma-70 factor (ECF subfamily) n=1 Tax=Chitinophaga ginsengisoli TaxID=363837 RepID=A0A2P8FQV7_9BACT|nr:sigma-70 family RNA polymerase sigma factor [Chitinophaga ginsengisoli]PSL24116.1 RNA polymerase sigma-70 factor (ECF subfamily) [Chitinophaga ginsengisoli]
MQIPDNATLIRQLNEGSERAFSLLFELYAKDVKACAMFYLKNPEDAEDVVQELFLEIWKRKGTLRIRGELRAYLISAAHNKSITKSGRNRKYALRKQLYSEELDLALVELPSFDKESDRVAQIRDALKKVPKKSREAFEMIYFGQMSYKEASALLGVSEATLKTHVQNAANSIRKELGSRKARGGSKIFLILFIYFLSQSCLQ